MLNAVSALPVEFDRRDDQVAADRGLGCLMSQRFVDVSRVERPLSFESLTNPLPFLAASAAPPLATRANPAREAMSTCFAGMSPLSSTIRSVNPPLGILGPGAPRSARAAGGTGGAGSVDRVGPAAILNGMEAYPCSVRVLVSSH